MKNQIVILAFLIFSISAKSQKTENSRKEKRTETTDKIAIQNLVDDFAILADKKDVTTQANLFTKATVVEIFRNNKIQDSIKQSEMVSKWQPFLNSLETVYHFMG